MCGIGSKPGPPKHHFDRSALVGVLTVEQAMIAAEATHYRRKQLAGAAVDPVERPSLLLQVERTDSHAGPPLCWKHHLIDVDDATHATLANDGIREDVPFLTSDPALLQ